VLFPALSAKNKREKINQKESRNGKKWKEDESKTKSTSCDLDIIRLLSILLTILVSGCYNSKFSTDLHC